MARPTLALVTLAAGALVASSALATDMGEIVSAETRAGSITGIAQTDSFWFEGLQGQGVVLNLSETAGSDPSFYPELRLYDPVGGLEASNFGSSTAEIQNHQLLQSGVYTIVVKDWYAQYSGNYALSLLLVPGAATSPSDQDGGGLQSAETVTGSIDLEADTNAYTFLGRAGEGVVVDMSEIAGSSASFYPELRLYDPLGGLELSDFDPGNAEIQNHQLLHTGVYTIVVRDWYGLYAGTYALSLLVIPGPTVSPGDLDGGTIASGQSKTGTVGGPADTDAFAFAGQVGNTVVLNLTKLAGSDPSYYPDLRLYDPLGGLEASDFGSSTAEIADHQLLETGIYTVVIRDWYGLYEGNYNLSLTKIPAGSVVSCSASATPQGGPGSPWAYSFASTVSGGATPYTFDWSFGDDSRSSAASPSHTYAAGGAYVWYLTVRDNGGNGCVAYGLVDVDAGELFADGFESGTTALWSSALPAE